MADTVKVASKWMSKSKQSSRTTKRSKPVNERVYGTSSHFRGVRVGGVGKPGRSDTPLRF